MGMFGDLGRILLRCAVDENGGGMGKHQYSPLLGGIYLFCILYAKELCSMGEEFGVE